MTKDTSPENLRKFLESDDSGLRGMGLSMAKGSGVPEDLYKNVFGLSLWDPEEGNREAAAELVEEIGLENITEFPGWMEPFDDASLKVADLKEKLHERELPTTGTKAELLARLASDSVGVKVRMAATWALGEIGDARAVELLIKALGDKDYNVHSSAAFALGATGDTRAVEPLIGALDITEDSDGAAAAELLGLIGDVRAVEPLEYELSELDRWDPGGGDLDYSTYRGAVEGALDELRKVLWRAWQGTRYEGLLVDECGSSIEVRMEKMGSMTPGVRKIMRDPVKCHDLITQMCDNWRPRDAAEFYEKLGDISGEELEYEVKKAQQSLLAKPFK